MENGGSMDGEQLPDEKKPVIQPAAEPRTVRPRGNQANGKRNQKSAPLSFSALRPSSLPAPSAMQSLGKLKETIHAPSPKVLGSPIPAATTPSTSEASQDATTLYDEPESPTIEGPSKAWQIFTRHQRDKTTFPNGTTIAEEDEDETSTSVAQGHAIDSSGKVAAPPMNGEFTLMSRADSIVDAGTQMERALENLWVDSLALFRYQSAFIWMPPLTTRTTRRRLR
jgi:hypothetical protein